MTRPKDSASHKSIEHVYGEQRTSLAGFLRRFFDSSHDVEDMLQEVFLKAYRAERSTKIKHPKAFLFKVAKHLSINKRKMDQGHRTDNMADLDTLAVIDNGTDVEALTINQDRLERALKEIDRLSPRVREVFVLRKIQGYSQREIAQHLGIAESTVEKHIARGVLQIAGRANRSSGRKGSDVAQKGNK